MKLKARTRWTTKDGKTRYIRLFQAWHNMRNRVAGNIGHDEYWTGLSITWKTFFDFRQWALNNGYKKGLTLERKDRELGYSPDNCEWITRAENCRRASNYRWSK